MQESQQGWKGGCQTVHPAHSGQTKKVAEGQAGPADQHASSMRHRADEKNPLFANVMIPDKISNKPPIKVLLPQWQVWDSLLERRGKHTSRGGLECQWSTPATIILP